MGEWYIEQKAQRYKLKQSSALAAIKEDTFFDRKIEKKTLSFHANEIPGIGYGFAKPYLISYNGTGLATLMQGLEVVGHFGESETKRISAYMKKHLHYGGMIPVCLENMSLDGGVDVVPVV